MIAFIIATQYGYKKTKKVPGKRRNAFITFEKCKWEQAKVKWGGKKCKPIKLSNLNHQNRSKKIIGMLG